MTRTFIVKNTLELNKECIKDLYKIKNKLGISYDEDFNEEDFKDYGLFNEDHHEWICEWIWKKDALKIFKKHKVSGEIILDGEGNLYGCKFIEGKLVSEEVVLSFKE